MSYLPAEFTITELAAILCVSRRVIEYRIKKGKLPATRHTNAKRSKHIILAATLKAHFPDVWDAIVHQQYYLDAVSDD